MEYQTVLPIQLLADAPGKAVGDGPTAWATAFHVGNQEKFLVPDFSRASLLLLQPFRGMKQQMKKLFVSKKGGEKKKNSSIYPLLFK